MPEEVLRKAELTVVLMFFVALAAAGIILIVVTVQDFARARASFSWPAVEAVILSASEGESQAPRYAYVVDGERHTSRRIGFFRLPFAGRVYDDVAPGMAVTVYVDPEKPSVAVLKPGGSSLIFLLMSLIAAVLVFVGVGGSIRTLMNADDEDWIDGEAFEGDMAE